MATKGTTIIDEGLLIDYLPPIIVFDEEKTILFHSKAAIQYFHGINDSDYLKDVLTEDIFVQISEHFLSKDPVATLPKTFFDKEKRQTYTLEHNKNNITERTYVLKVMDSKEESIPILGNLNSMEIDASKKYKAIFDNTLDAIILSDFKNTKAVECNERATVMFGTHKQEIVEGGVLAFSPDFQADGKKSKDSLEAIRQKMLGKGGGSILFPWIYKRKNGETFAAEVVVSLIEINNRKTWLNIIRDISERKRNQEALKKSFYKFQALFNSTFDLAFLLDKKGNILEANNSACDILRINPIENKNKPIWDSGWWQENPISAKQLRTVFDAVVESKEPYRFTIRFKGEKEEELVFDFWLKPFEQSEDDIQMLLEGREVTQLTQVKEEIKKNERLYRSIIRNTQGTTIFLYDKSLKFTLVEGNYIEMFTYDKDQILGKTAMELIPDKAMGERINGILEDSIKGQLNIFEEKYNDSYYYIKTVPLREFDSSIKFAMLIVQDITDIKKAEGELKIKINEIEEQNVKLERYIMSNQELENFAYMVSHDLKEPLRNIMGFTQLLKNNYEDKFDQIGKEYLDFIVNGGKRMETLINSLLEYSKVNQGEFSFSEVETDILISMATNSVMNAIVENHVSINISRNMPAMIVAEPARLAQLFQNLLANAIRFKKEENIQPIIHIDVESKPDFWEFSVKDNGIGIAKEFHQSIFSLFKKTPSGKKRKGSGIGLSICKRIVEQHKGEIWVESEDGEGATFFFTISKDLPISA